jgi:tetratricopeptide (TPR) repeat protein
MKLRVALGVLLGLTALGRFLPGPAAWGFNHLAYLPGWFVFLWTLCAALLFVPGFQRKASSYLADTLSPWLFGRAVVPVVLALLAGGLFVLFRERSFFMGDGYLVGELQDQGVKFRAFDALDFLLHFQIFQFFHRGHPDLSAFTIYRVASVVAGVMAVLIHWSLVRRLPWEPWRQAAAFFLLFSIGPVALYFGYVESYTYLFVFVTAFLLSGLLVLEGKAPLWLASTFFGLGMAFHLTTVASGPALLFLVFRSPVRSASRRWLEVLIPPLSLFALAGALYLAEGYNAFWFRKEFLESKNTHQLLIPLAAGRGLFSVYHWKDQLNLLLITAPACLAVVLMEHRRLLARRMEPRIQFLLAQILPIVLCSIVLDRKLGGARDWDLLAAHAGGLVLLSALLLPARPVEEREPARPAKGKAPKGPKSVPDPAVGMVLGTAVLLVSPWVLLLHLEPRSIDRFVSVAADFPAFPRAYAYEEVGKYYRKANDLEKALPMYQLCVQTYPGNPRFHVLLGSIYFMKQDMDHAEAEYQAALKANPKDFMAMEMMGKVAFGRKDWKGAVSYFRSWWISARWRPPVGSSWASQRPWRTIRRGRRGGCTRRCSSTRTSITGTTWVRPSCA